MVYKLIITDRAEELVDQSAYHLVHILKNKQAAMHLFEQLDKIYKRLEENPYQFPLCKDAFLKHKEYREAVLSEMNYIVVFRVEDNLCNIVGFFHQLENYYDRI